MDDPTTASAARPTGSGSDLVETLKRNRPPQQTDSAGWKAQQTSDDEVHSERWLLSYADFVTLLMVLFMVLYALQLVKAKDVAINQLRSRPVAQATQQSGDASQRAEESRPAERGALQMQLSALTEQGQVRLSQDSRGVEIDINANTLFNSGDARLLPQSKAVLTQVAAALKANSKHDILVEGHTDSVPIATAKYESNWELSSARAGAVVRFLIDQGLEPQRLSAMGRADNVPAAIGDDPETLAKNRRVTILVQN